MIRADARGVRAVGEGLFVGPLDRLDALRLAGTRCRDCTTTAFTTSVLCPNCGGSDVETVALARHATVTTFSIMRHRPPGDYKGPEPFAPFPIALVALPDGVAVVTPLDMPIDAVEVGQEVTLAPHILYRDGGGYDVVAFRFAPRTGERP